MPRRIEAVVDDDGEQVDHKRDEVRHDHFLIQHLFEHWCLLDRSLQPEDSPEHEQARDQLKDSD